MDINICDELQSFVNSYFSFLFCPWLAVGSPLHLDTQNCPYFDRKLANESSDAALESLIISLLSVGKMLQDHLARFLPQIWNQPFSSRKLCFLS